MNIWRMEPVTELFQAAALDATLWPAALDHVARIADGAGVCLLSTDSRFATPPTNPALNPTTEVYMRDGWNLRDERYRGIPTLLRKGITVDEDFTCEAEMRRSPYYQDFLRRHGLGPFAGVGFKAGGDLWVLVVMRHFGQGPFDRGALRKLATLSRPLDDAATLARQLCSARLDGMTDALELTMHPAVALDGRGLVLALNALAHGLVGDLFDIAGGHLIFRDQRSQAHVDALLRRMLQRDGALDSSSSTATGITNRWGRPVPVRAVELQGWSRCAFTQARLLLLFGARPATSDDEEPVFAAAFGLTPREAHVAAALLRGQSIRQVAGQLGVSYETARSHVRSVFFKTATHRQGELVAMLRKSLP